MDTKKGNKKAPSVRGLFQCFRVFLRYSLGFLFLPGSDVSLVLVTAIQSIADRAAGSRHVLTDRRLPRLQHSHFRLARLKQLLRHLDQYLLRYHYRRPDRLVGT